MQIYTQRVIYIYTYRNCIFLNIFYKLYLKSKELYSLGIARLNLTNFLTARFHGVFNSLMRMKGQQDNVVSPGFQNYLTTEPSHGVGHRTRAHSRDWKLSRAGLEVPCLSSWQMWASSLHLPKLGERDEILRGAVNIKSSLSGALLVFSFSSVPDPLLFPSLLSSSSPIPSPLQPASRQSPC